MPGRAGGRRRVVFLLPADDLLEQGRIGSAADLTFERRKMFHRHLQRRNVLARYFPEHDFVSFVAEAAKSLH